jgi:ketosteroid isomerase-like protein
MIAVIERLLAAVNGHDLEGLVDCFDSDYVNETPVHPLRGFTGNDQVRTNWSQIFGGVRDIEAKVLRTAEEGDVVWTEWDMTGTRTDGGPFAMAGVVIFGVTGDVISSARFYLEPVEQASGDVDDHTHRVVTGKERS